MTEIIGKTLFLKKKILTIKRLLTFSWHGRHRRHLGLPWLNAGSCHRPPQTNLEFNGFHTFICTRTARKNTQKKSDTQRQVSTARTTAQHPKGFIAPKLLTRGRYSTNVYTGRLRPEVQPGTFLYTIFHEKVTPFVYLLLTNGTPFTYMYTLFRTLHSF